jgi:hypothetical protein
MTCCDHKGLNKLRTKRSSYIQRERLNSLYALQYQASMGRLQTTPQLLCNGVSVPHLGSVLTSLSRMASFSLFAWNPVHKLLVVQIALKHVTFLYVNFDLCEVCVGLSRVLLGKGISFLVCILSKAQLQILSFSSTFLEWGKMLYYCRIAHVIFFCATSHISIHNLEYSSRRNLTQTPCHAILLGLHLYSEHLKQNK